MITRRQLIVSAAATGAAAGLMPVRAWAQASMKLGEASIDIVSDGHLQLPVSMVLGRVPATLELTFADGSRDRHTYPVEMWHLGPRFVARIATARRVTAVRLDPDGVYPDVNRDNDRWPATAPSPP